MGAPHLSAILERFSQVDLGSVLGLMETQLLLLVRRRTSFLLSLPAVFAMETNVSKTLVSGASTVLSPASLPTREPSRRAGPKVFDDGRKSVYALSPQQVLDLRPLASMDRLSHGASDSVAIIYNNRRG